MNKNELIKILKKDNYNDYCVFLNSVLHGFKYWIFGNKTDALKCYNHIKNNSENFKPCTLEIINLWGV